VLVQVVLVQVVVVQVQVLVQVVQVQVLVQVVQVQVQALLRVRVLPALPSAHSPPLLWLVPLQLREPLPPLRRGAMTTRHRVL